LRLPFDFLDQRPIVIAIGGSNGAGKSTFYESLLSDSGLRFVNADALADGLQITAYEAADAAAVIRTALVAQRESFIFETVLSDPVGDKVNSLASYTALGYTVVLIFIQIDSVDESIRRVAMRVSQGGHDVPDEKLRFRFSRTQANLKRAIKCLPYVLVYNHSDLSHPYELVALYENGQEKPLAQKR
jgi:predicted ABC-type ATPase